MKKIQPEIVEREIGAPRKIIRRGEEGIRTDLLVLAVSLQPRDSVLIWDRISDGWSTLVCENVETFRHEDGKNSFYFEGVVNESVEVDGCWVPGDMGASYIVYPI